MLISEPYRYRITDFDRKPHAEHKTLSVHDPEARRGKHGEWYEGFIVDILMDADSELITQVNVLEAGGDEARDAVDLIRAEQAAQGNRIEALSIDGAGFNGQMLRELEGPAAETAAPVPAAEVDSTTESTALFFRDAECELEQPSDRGSR